MTDKDNLFLYRLKQAEETLTEAKKMLDSGFSSRSIINRVYYSMFYTLLALFIKTGVKIKTSKHSGIITLFDKEFVKTGKIDSYFSKILHDIFDARLEGDYKEFAELSAEDVLEHVKLAEKFLENTKNFIDKNTEQ